MRHVQKGSSTFLAGAQPPAGQPEEAAMHLQSQSILHAACMATDNCRQDDRLCSWQVKVLIMAIQKGYCSRC